MCSRHVKRSEVTCDFYKHSVCYGDKSFFSFYFKSKVHVTKNLKDTDSVTHVFILKVSLAKDNEKNEVHM